MKRTLFVLAIMMSLVSLSACKKKVVVEETPAPVVVPPTPAPAPTTVVVPPSAAPTTVVVPPAPAPTPAPEAPKGH